MQAPSEIREEVVREGNIGRPKMPLRRWKTQPRPHPATKIEFSPKIDEIVPIQVNIEVQAGPDDSAHCVSAYRVLKQLGESGAPGEIVEVTGEGSTLVAEVDKAQAVDLAHSPFVRRIVSMN